MATLKFIDLFCGIGGFRYAMEAASREQGHVSECVFSSDIDEPARLSYKANFGHLPSGDITKIHEKDIPDHDVLFAGFPCQPFSIIGEMKGFEDIRGTLFFDIARIIQKKQPKAFVLENVKQLVGHNGGHTLEVILDVLDELGYNPRFTVLNALDFGLPQKRERCIIVGIKDKSGFKFPVGARPYTPLSRVLERDVDEKYYASEHILNRRRQMHRSAYELSIWHENKAGNICSYPYSCALRSGASYNYLLVNGERRLTPRETLRLQGFPERFKIVVSDNELKRQTGNAVPVAMVKAVISKLLPYLAPTEVKESVAPYANPIAKTKNRRKIKGGLRA